MEEIEVRFRGELVRMTYREGARLQIALELEMGRVSRERLWELRRDRHRGLISGYERE